MAGRSPLNKRVNATVKMLSFYLRCSVIVNKPIILVRLIFAFHLLAKMIEINAKLVREQRSFFLCGEIVECFISFAHPSLPEYKIAQGNK